MTMVPGVSRHTGGRPSKVVHVITDLDVGGAEMVLYRLLERIDRDRFSSEVVSLTDEGRVAPLIRELGVPVASLGLTRKVAATAGVAKVAGYLRRDKPDLVQTWMYHADLIGGVGARLARVHPVVWGLHAAPDREREQLGRAVRSGLRVAASLSRWVPERIICCSYETERVHARLGYARHKLVVIPNGFEPRDRLEGAGAELRRELGLPDGTLLIGRIGRDHPQKDNPTLLRAFARVRRQVPSARLVMVGDGMVWSNAALAEELRTLGLTASDVSLLGPRDDVTRVNSSVDVAVSSSYSEGLPVVLGEAMSVATPVVSTDAGDSSYLVDDRDRVVPVSDPDALAAALISVLRRSPEERRTLGERDRDRIRESFAFDAMLTAYEGLYLSLLGRS